MGQYLVFDIGGTNLKCALLDSAGNIIEKGKKPTVKSGLNDFLKEMYEIADQYKGKFKEIAISCPGKIDVDNKIIHFGGGLPLLDGVNIQELFGDKYGVPVGVENDGKAAALTEMWLGALKDVVSGEMLTLGSEVGGGIVVGGQLIHDAHLQAGEPSFMRYDMNCADWSGFTGQKGPAVSIIKCVNETLSNSDLEDGQKTFEATNTGNAQALQISEEYRADVANIILSVQAVIDGKRVVVAGGISAQDIVIETIRKQYQASANKFHRVNNELTVPEIVRTKLENDANIYGALYALPLDINGQSEEVK